MELLYREEIGIRTGPWEGIQVYPVGSVFLDNTTLAQATLRYPVPDAVSTASLACFVEALAVHEQVYVLDAEGCGDIISSMNTLAPGTVRSIGTKDAIDPDTLVRLSEELAQEALELDILHYPDMLEEIEELLELDRAGDPVGSLVVPGRRAADLWRYRWSVPVDSGRPGITAEGTILARTLLYYLAARSQGIAYSPNAARTNTLARMIQVLGPFSKDAGELMMGTIDEIRKHHAQMIYDVMGLPAVRLEMPLFLSLALEGAESVEDVIANASKIRNLEEVVALRRWCSSLVRDFMNEDFVSVDNSLTELESAKDTLMRTLKPHGTLPIAIAWPLSIGTDLESVQDRLLGREPLCLMRDILTLNMRGLKGSSILARLKQRVRNLRGMAAD